MTTNVGESWYLSLKTHGKSIIISLTLLRFYYKLIYNLGKAALQRFSLTRAANHVLRIGDQWEIRSPKEGIDFRTTHTPECQDYPRFALSIYPVQSPLVEQYMIARKEIMEGEETHENVEDDFVCRLD